MNEIIENITNNYSNTILNANVIISVLLVTLVLAIYEFLVYRFVSHRSFYNKSFNISITVMPLFISTIILCLQSNVIVTLGAIGILAIIRYRTAVKDPVDMLYILWSVHTGIICGCRLYEIAVITSILVTILLIVLEHLTIGKRPYIVLIHTKEDVAENIIKKCSRKYSVKSRNYTSNGIDYTFELSINDISKLTSELKKSKSVERFSVIEYSADDIM
jgi:hypothetical protein